MSKAIATTDHETIRRWAEEHGGTPAAVTATAKKDEPGILRIDFPGYSGQDTLEAVSWDEFFQKFDESGLEFLYQDKVEGVEDSRFCKFISRQKPK